MIGVNAVSFGLAEGKEIFCSMKGGASRKNHSIEG